MNPKMSSALQVVKLAARILDEKKAGDLAVMDVSAQSSITDFLILATGTSEPHLRALRVELEKAFDAAGVHLVGMEAPQASGWYVIDAFDVMVHLFSPDLRQRYALDRLWRDAVELNVQELLKEAKPAAKARSSKPVKRATAVAKGGKKKASGKARSAKN